MREQRSIFINFSLIKDDNMKRFHHMPYLIIGIFLTLCDDRSGMGAGQTEYCLYLGR